MDIDKVEFDGEDITDDVVEKQVEPADETGPAPGDEPVLFQSVDLHANDKPEDVKEVTEDELIEKVFPLPEDFPSQDQIDQWRSKYGRIRIRRLGPQEAYIIRPMLRGDVYKYENLIARVEGMEGYEQVAANLEIEEFIVSGCLLYPKVTREQLHGDDKEFAHPILVGGTIGILALDVLVSSNLMGETPTIVEDI